MFVIWWRSILAKLTNNKSRSGKRRRPKGSKISSYRAWLEPLEDRFAPATLYWDRVSPTAPPALLVQVHGTRLPRTGRTALPMSHGRTRTSPFLQALLPPATAP